MYEAIERYNQSIELRKEIDDKYGLAMSHFNLGELYKDEGDFEKAIDHSNLSLYYALKGNLKVFQRDAYMLLSEAHKGQGNFETALDFYHTYVELKDNLLSEESKSSIDLMTLRFENEKLVRENEELKNLGAIDDKGEGRWFTSTIVLGIVSLVLLIFVFALVRRRQ